MVRNDSLATWSTYTELSWLDGKASPHTLGMFVLHGQAVRGY